VTELRVGWALNESVAVLPPTGINQNADDDEAALTESKRSSVWPVRGLTESRPVAATDSIRRRPPATERRETSDLSATERHSRHARRIAPITTIITEKARQTDRQTEQMSSVRHCVDWRAA